MPKTVSLLMAKKTIVYGIKTNRKGTKVKQQVKRSQESPYCSTLLFLSLLICSSL